MPLHPVVHPDHAAVQGFRGEVPEGLASRRLLPDFAGILANARHPSQPIDARIHEGADLIDQPGLQEGAVGRAAALEEKCPDSEALAKGCHGAVQVTPSGPANRYETPSFLNSARYPSDTCSPRTVTMWSPPALSRS